MPTCAKASHQTLMSSFISIDRQISSVFKLNRVFREASSLTTTGQSTTSAFNETDESACYLSKYHGFLL